MRRVTPRQGVVYSFRHDAKPILSVDPGETVEFVCEDSCGGQIRSEVDRIGKLDFDRVNGATGPVEVRGANPGDVLRVRILDIRTSGEGFQAIGPNLGVLGKDVKAERTKMIRIRNGVALFSEGIQLPTKPHVGTVGVAPRQGEWTTFYPGDHGETLTPRKSGKGPHSTCPCSNLAPSSPSATSMPSWPMARCA